MAISHSSDMLCFDLYLINIFAKSMKVITCTLAVFKLTLYGLSDTVEDLNLYRRYRYKDINILGARYFVVLDSTLGARLAYDTSVCLMFPALPYFFPVIFFCIRFNLCYSLWVFFLFLNDLMQLLQHIEIIYLFY